MKLLELILEYFYRKVEISLYWKRNMLWGLGGGFDFDNFIYRKGLFRVEE